MRLSRQKIVDCVYTEKIIRWFFRRHFTLLRNLLFRSDRIFALFSLLLSTLVVYGLVDRPAYTDAYYHQNAALSLVEGAGWTDPYLWNYIGAPDALPAPSHLYWMPATSFLAAAGMRLFNAPGNIDAAQVFFLLAYWLTTLSGFWLGKKLGGEVRHAWAAGLLTLFSGYFVRFWGTIDTFAPYALFGALCLIWIGLAASAETPGRRRLFWLLAGVFAGFAHLTRADGLLLLVVAWAVIGWPFDRRGWRDRFGAFLLVTAAYLFAMLPWFLRNLDAVGAPLPVGGTQAIWFTEYNDLFSYPPDANPGQFFAGGIDLLIQSRWEALINNLGTFVAVEGLVAMTPLMLIALWKRRKDPFLRGFGLYVVGLHLAMTLIFPYPGYRGGLFHSAAALVPWWAALGALGVEDAVGWMAKHRRTWKAAGAARFFTAALILLAIFLSVSIGLGGQTPENVPERYRRLAELLPEDARVMINDPAELYYFTKLSGVALPNESPQIIPEIARRYGITHLVLDKNVPAPLVVDPQNPPEFLTLLDLGLAGVWLYEIQP